MGPETATGANPSLVWIDPGGRVTRTVPLDGGTYCAIVNWPTGHVFAFIAGTSVRPTQGQWYDAARAPLTPWFDVGIGKGRGGYQRLNADGVVALGTLGLRWVTAVREGEAGTEVLPAWLAARPGTRLVTVRGGRGFAVLPAAGIGSLEIVTTAGESCGTVTMPEAER